MGTWDSCQAHWTPVIYVVQVAGKLWKHHIDHIREPKTGNDLLDEGAAAVPTGGSTSSTSPTEPPPSNSALRYPL